jgi:predicted RecB family endonuclease
MSKMKGLSSERIAKRLLESRGFHILSTKHIIKEGEEKVAEVDIIAENSYNERYAVEVKAGKGDVNSIRQTFANAKLCRYKPMLICKGYADNAARKAALKLDVRVVELSEYYLLLEPEELESIIKKCVEEVFETHGFLPYSAEVDDKDRKLLKAISKAKNFDEAAEHININRKDFGKKIEDLTTRGILPKRSLSFGDLKRCSSSILARSEIISKLNEIERRIK